jgi:general secretion pathway protein C
VDVACQLLQALAASPMPLDQSLRKTFWLVPFPLVAIAAFLNAQAITQLVGAFIDLDANQLAQAPPALLSGASSSPLPRLASADPILKRNPFDHVTGSLHPPPEAHAGDSSPREIDASDPWSAPTCDDLDVDAIAASDDEDWSFVALSGPDKKRHLLRRGGEMYGKKVYFIGWDRLWLSSDGGLCQAILFDAKKKPPPSVPAPPLSPRVPTPSSVKPLDADLRKGIRRVSATEFNIDRGVVDKILENQADLMRQARIVPVQENGRVVGIRLSGIRPDALLGVLGMQDGDQLRTINGFEMASPEKALEAYARLRTADKLTIQLNRGGKTINIDYNIN